MERVKIVYHTKEPMKSKGDGVSQKVAKIDRLYIKMVLTKVPVMTVVTTLGLKTIIKHVAIHVIQRRKFCKMELVRLVMTIINLSSIQKLTLIPIVSS